MRKWEIVFMVVAFLLVSGICVYVTDQRDEQMKKNEALISQNKALTAMIRTAKVESFRAGVDACTNEDIQFFNDTAAEYPGVVAKVMESWAQNWAYTDDALNKLTEEYMEEMTH